GTVGWAKARLRRAHHLSSSAKNGGHASLCPPYDPCANYGRVDILVGGPTLQTRSANRANSHNSERVLRGSITSSTQNFSAERNGERSLLRRSSISFSFAAGSSEPSMSAR